MVCCDLGLCEVEVWEQEFNYSSGQLIWAVAVQTFPPPNVVEITLFLKILAIPCAAAFPEATARHCVISFTPTTPPMKTSAHVCSRITHTGVFSD